MSLSTGGPKGPVNPALRLSGIGLELVAAIVGMMLLGWAVDRWLGSSPVWMLVGLTLGFIGGGYNFIREAMASNRQAKEAYDREHARRAGRSEGPKSDPD